MENYYGENIEIQRQIREKYLKEQIRLREELSKGDFVINVKSQEDKERIKECCNLDFDKENLEQEMVLVRASDFLPQNGEILSTKNAGVVFNNKTLSHRNTVHFALNHRVSSHFFGSWEDTKYIMLLPFENKDNILELGSVDTYFEDKVSLPKGTAILIKKDEYEKLTDEEKKEFDFIPYEGDSKSAVQEALILMGKKPQLASPTNIENERNSKLILEYAKKNIKNRVGGHFESYINEFEMATYERDEIINKMRADGKIIDTRFSQVPITIEEVKSIISRQLFYKGRYNGDMELNKFVHAIMSNGIERNENGEYVLLSDKEALKRIKDNKEDSSLNIAISNGTIDEYKDIYELYQLDLVLNKYYGDELSEEEESTLRDLLDDFYQRHIISVSESEIRSYQLSWYGQLKVATDNKVVYDKFDEISSKDRSKLKDGDSSNGTFVTDFLPQKEGEKITIRQMIQRAENYIALFEELYQGKDVRFNQYGEREESKYSKQDYEEIYKQVEKGDLLTTISNLRQTEEEKYIPTEDYGPEQ